MVTAFKHVLVIPMRDKLYFSILPHESPLTLFGNPSQGATKILARQLIRLRQQIANLQGSRAQIRGIATHTQVHY